MTNPRILFLLLGSGVLGCGSSDEEKPLFQSQNREGPSSCSLSGSWATFVEVGVGWVSGTIRAGAGTLRQWILSQRAPDPGSGADAALDTARACGIGAVQVPLGSAWFSTIEVMNPQLMLDSEWIGVEFLASLFDAGLLPTVQIPVRSNAADPANAPLGSTFESDAAPFQFGVDSLLPTDPWPDWQTMKTIVVDHDQDGKPGLTATPRSGAVPGEPDGVMFSKPRLDITTSPVPRATELFMAIRTRAALRGDLRSCDPPKFVGTALPESLVIESRIVGCTVEGTGAPCTDDPNGQTDWLDTNLPAFTPNGTSKIVSIKVPDGTTCAEVREMRF